MVLSYQCWRENEWRADQLEKLTKGTLCLVDIAPYPSRRWDSAHDGMLCFMEVPGRVLARRGIATANVAARLALAKSDPKSSLDQALFTRVGSSLRGKIFRGKPLQMFT